MNSIKSKQSIVWTALATYVLFLLIACTKTEYEYLKRSDTHIESFSFVDLNTGDTVEAVVYNDTIYAYWDDDTERPESITPEIALSTGATIVPSSGESVLFAAGTTYVVTAEDGTQKTYYLYPDIQQAIPRSFSFPEGFKWSSTINSGSLIGEYFLSRNDTADIKAYARRITDGFEFDLTINSVSSSSINVSIPDFNAEMDGGYHQLVFDFGNGTQLTSDSTYIAPPDISYANPVYSVRVNELSENIAAGDYITIDYTMSDEYDGKVVKHYQGKFINYATVRAGTRSVVVTDSLEVTDSYIRIKIPSGVNTYAGSDLRSVAVGIPNYNIVGGMDRGLVTITIPEGSRPTIVTD